MPPKRTPTLPATPEELHDAIEYASKLEHAFAVRPPVDWPSRRRWEVHFKQDLYALIQQLAKADFEELPAFAMGCIWLHNHARHNKIPFDLEAIVPAQGDHPALKGPGRLRYGVAEDGPSGLRPENELRSVWWDTFRQEAIERELHARHNPPEKAAVVVAKANRGAEDVADDQRSAEALSSHRASTVATVPAQPHGAPSIPPAPQTRSRAGRVKTTSSKLDDATSEASSAHRASDIASAPAEPQGAPSVPPAPQSRSRAGRARPASSKANEAVPEAPPQPSGLSEKAAGKRRAATRERTRRTAPESPQGTMTLNDIEPETIKDTFVEHPRPCARCARRRQPCLFNPLFKSSCNPCVIAKSACTLRFDVKQDHVVAAYLGYAYLKMITTPSIFAEPEFFPDKNPKPLPTRESIQWYTEQYNASDTRRDLVDKAAAEEQQISAASEDPVPDTSRRSRRQAASKPAASSTVPQEATGSNTAGQNQAARPTARASSRARSRASSRGQSRAPSRAPSAASSTLRETPASFATTPPPSPSAVSTTSQSAGAHAAIEVHRAEELPAPTKRKKAAPRTGSGRSNRGAGPSRKPPRTQGQASNVSLPDELTSMDEHEVTLPPSDSAHLLEDPFDPDGDTSDFPLGHEGDTDGDGLANHESPPALAAEAPVSMDAPPAVSEHGKQRSPTHRDSSGVPQHLKDIFSGTGVRPRESVPGLLSLEYTASLGKRQVGVIHPSVTELTQSTTRKTVPMPPSRPSSLEPPSHRDFRVPPINGTWRGLRRLGERNANGQYSILPPSSVVTAPREPAKMPPPTSDPAVNACDERPATPPNCQFVFGKETHQLARDTKAKYMAVSSLAATLEHDGTLLAQQATGILAKHTHFANKIEVSRTWGEAVIPMMAQSSALANVLQDLVEIVAHMKSVLAGICDVFHVVPPIPANWVALAEIIETGRRLQELYRFAWAKIDQLEDDIQPTEVEDSISPLFRNLSRSVSATVAELSSRVDVLDGTDAERAPQTTGPRSPCIGDLVAALTTLTEQLENVEERLCALEDAEDATDEEDEDEDDDEEDEGEDEDEGEEDVESERGIEGAARTRHPSIGTRSDGSHPHAISAEVIHKHVATYLATFGISEDILRRLAMQGYYSSIPAPPGGSISTSGMFTGGGLTGAFHNRWTGPSGISTSGSAGGSSSHEMEGTASTLIPLSASGNSGPQAEVEIAHRDEHASHHVGSDE